MRQEQDFSFLLFFSIGFTDQEKRKREESGGDSKTKIERESNFLYLIILSSFILCFLSPPLPYLPPPTLSSHSYFASRSDYSKKQSDSKQCNGLSLN